MNISGKVKKDIYRQTGACSLLVNLTTFSYLDEARLIFSGSGQSPLNFLLRSGKIYGSANNFIGTYSNTELLSFSGNFSSGKYDIYLDGNPRIIGNYRTGCRLGQARLTSRYWPPRASEYLNSIALPSSYSASK